MNNLVKKAGLGIALAATTLSVAAPADAQRWRRYDRHRGGDAAGAAVLGGIVGLGLGAAIASSNRDRYYDRGYYYDRGPRYRDYYYAPPPPRYYRPYRGYAPRYYDGPRYRGYYDGYGW